MIQELLTNIRKHAQATQVDVRLLYHPSDSPLLRLYVRDNGRGLLAEDPLLPVKPAVLRGGLGLRGIQQRVAALQGTCVIRSSATANQTPPAHRQKAPLGFSCRMDTMAGIQPLMHGQGTLVEIRLPIEPHAI
jgi:signal transduction histidine kinase